MKLLTLGNTKTLKSKDYGVLTAILHLLPSDLSGRNVCPKASAGCKAVCLNTAGHGRWDATQRARKRRTDLYFDNKPAFEAHLVSDIYDLIELAKKEGLRPAVRINGTSDLPALAIKMARMFPDVQFYDYTKIAKTFERPDLPANYHLTFSRSESNDRDARKILARGFPVSIVFDSLPETWNGFPVINGDKHDLTFLHPPGVVIGLSPKGQARSDTSGFVVRTIQ